MGPCAPCAIAHQAGTTDEGFRAQRQTHLRDLAARFARALPSISCPPVRGRGECRAPDAPAVACAEVVVESTRACQVTPESPGIPRAMVYGLYRALPGDRAFLPPSSALLSCELDTSVGVSGPHDFAVRFGVARLTRRCVHRILPRRPVTFAKRPSCWDRMAGVIILICPTG